jgi:hypothetical protein
MAQSESLTHTLAYGQKLINAGVSGIRNGHEAALHGQSFSELLAETARESLALAATGALVGMLQAWLTHRHRRLPNAIAGGAVGSAVGFCVGFAWGTRKRTSMVAHSALREVDRVRDERWLEMNPIDYA